MCRNPIVGIGVTLRRGHDSGTDRETADRGDDVGAGVVMRCVAGTGDHEPLEAPGDAALDGVDLRQRAVLVVDRPGRRALAR